MSLTDLARRFARMDELETRLLGELRAAGYHRIYTPTFAPLADYAGSLGDEVRTEFLTFVLGSEQVLRPEFTTKVVQTALARPDGDDGHPLRLAYVGPTFRVHRQTGPFPHEFQQLGGELVGREAPGGDLEVLGILDQLARAAGAGPWQLRVSHASLLDALLVSVGTPAELAERIRRDLHRLGRHSDRLLGADAVLRDVLPRMLAARARRVDGPEGPATTDARALVSWERSVLAAEWAAAGASQTALALIDSACSTEGSLDALENWVRQVAGPDAAAAPLGELRAMLDGLGEVSADAVRVTLDPCVVRDLSYYTGLVFDICAGPDAVVIGGGGRYDRLVEAVGDVSPRPAIGFALDLGALAGIPALRSATEAS